MAFKKTQGRQVYVSPVGLPDLSGFREAARQYSNMSQFAMSVGTDIRHREFNDAIVEAEIAGKTNGVKYQINPETGQKELAPLVNLNYTQANNLATDKEREIVADVYRKAAVSAYTASAVNDIESQAELSLINNPSDPDAIMADFSGALSGLQKSVEPEVFQALAPKAEAAYIKARNKAVAQLQKNVNEQSKIDLGTQFTRNYQELGALLAVGSSGDEDEVALFEERVTEIAEENAGILENMQSFNASPQEIDAFQTAQVQHVARAVGESYLTKTYMGTNGSYSSTLSAIDNVINDVQDPKINKDTLRNSLEAFALSMHKQDQEFEKEQAENRTNINQEVTRQRMAGVRVEDMLRDPLHIIHTLLPTQQENQLDKSTSYFDKINKDAYDADYAYLKDWQNTIGTPEQDNLFRRFSNVKEMFDQGLIGWDKFSDAKTAIKEYIDAAFVSPDATQRGFILKKELGELSSYVNPPQFYMDFLPDAVNLNIVGKGRTFEDADAYLNAVESYAKRYQTNMDKRLQANASLSKAFQGKILSDTEINNIVDVTPSYNAVMKDGSVVTPNFYTEDEALLQASIDAADRFANETNGLLLPELKGLIDSAYREPKVADTLIRGLGQIVDGMHKVYGGDKRAHFYDLMETNGYTDGEQSFILDVLATSPELAVEAHRGNNGPALANANKIIQDHTGNRLSGKLMEDSAREFTQEQFTRAMTGHDFYAFFNPKISVQDQRMIDELGLSVGIKGRELKNAVIGNERVFNTLQGLFFSKLSSQRGAGDPKQAMRQAVLSLGKRFGFQKNTVTGKIELVDRPMMHYAQAAVPTMKTLDGRRIPVATLTETMVIEDVVRKFLGTDTPDIARMPNKELDDAVKAALDPKSGYGSDINFYANDNFGGEQTYTVVLTDHYQNPTVLFPDYKFDWDTSVHSSRYKKVLDNIQTSRMKKVWSSYGLLDQSLINAGLQAHSSRQAQVKAMGDILRNLDYLRLMTSPGATPEFIESLGDPFTEEEINDFFYIFDQIGSAGYR